MYGSVLYDGPLLWYFSRKCLSVDCIPMFAFSVFCALAFFPSYAEAYLDPGAGGALLQILLGGAFGALAVLKIYWQSVKEFFRRFTRNKPDA